MCVCVYFDEKQQRRVKMSVRVYTHTKTERPMKLLIKSFEIQPGPNNNIKYIHQHLYRRPKCEINF